MFQEQTNENKERHRVYRLPKVQEGLPGDGTKVILLIFSTLTLEAILRFLPCHPCLSMPR